MGRGSSHVRQLRSIRCVHTWLQCLVWALVAKTPLLVGLIALQLVLAAGILSSQNTVFGFI